MLISAKALKFRPDSSMTRQFRIVADTNAERELRREARRASNAGPTAPPRHRHDSTARQIDTAPATGTPAFVWVRQGDSLVEKRVTTGLNNDTQVQILSGLDDDDEVVDGAEVQTAAEAKGGAVRSPFMPARRGGGGNRGGGGGGGGRRQ
jgi:HlyD family secretion protein